MKHDTELEKYLEKIQWHTPYTKEDVIGAYYVAKNSIINKLKEKIVLFGGEAQPGIHPEELDNL